MSASRWRAALAAPLLATALAVAAAFQFTLPVTIDMGAPFLSARLTRDFHDAEAGYRWSRETGFVRVPGPGPRSRVLMDVTLSAWRPRGQQLPDAALAADGHQQVVATTPRPQTVRLETESRHPWSGIVELSVASETAQPGRTDPRRVGVRVHTVRLVAPSAFCPGLPPLRALVLSLLLTAAIVGTALRARVSGRAARGAGFATAAALAAAHLLVRAYAFVLLTPALVLATAALVLAPVLPAVGRAVADTVAAAMRRLVTGARALVPLPAVAIAVVALSGTWIAYAVRPVLDLDLGSGIEEPFGHGLLAYDADGPMTFRHAGNGAALDLRDLGGGTTWTVDVRGAGPAVVTVDGEAAAAALTAGWSTAGIRARAPWGWRPGLRLAIGGDDARIDGVRIDRGRSLPSPRVAVAVAAAGCFIALLFAAAGCPRRDASAAGMVLAIVAAGALAAAPLLAPPLAARFAVIALAAALLAALAAAVNERGGGALPAAAISACAVGFVAWLAAPLTPLYRGGHFIFHSSIAEEIWQGRLLHYALPYPGSMLSQQAQWGNVVVPHPCLFHLVAAPLAALPRPWFYTAVKAALALWLAAMAACAALLAGRIAGRRAATFAAVAVVATPATYQLIGLGHLMTIFGCWAMAMAVTFVALRFDRLTEARTFGWAVALLTVCFLSYTAALLFTMLLLAFGVPVLWRAHPRQTRRLIAAASAAAAAAFAIYYVHWAGPFLRESVPRLLHGAAAPAAPLAAGSGDRALAARLALQPHKLAYTFGTPLVPLAGLAGLVMAAGAAGPAAVLALAWATMLVLFGAADVFFNFLLKHHYFTVVPIAAGIGALLARLPDTRPGRWTAAVLLAAMAALGAAVALAVATGRIP